MYKWFKNFYMRFNKNVVLTICFITALFTQNTVAQSLNGKIIYVSTTQVILIKFSSVIQNYDFANQKEAASLFETRLINEKNLSITSTTPNFKSTNLIVTEGKNTHLLILVYKEILDGKTESIYDFSTKEKLRNEAKIVEQESVTPPVKQPTEPAVTQPSANNTIVLTQKEIDIAYADIITKANRAYSSNNLDEASVLYTNALKLKHNDTWSTTQINAIQNKKKNTKILDQKKTEELAYKNHIRIADSAFIKKSYSKATLEYTQALGEKSNDPYAQSQLKKIEQLLKSDSYKSYMEIGRDALKNQLFDNASMAFNEALKIRPNDPEAKKEMSKILSAKTALSEKQKEDKSGQNKLSQFNDTLSLANNMFEAGMYDEAKKRYLKADKIKPGDAYVAKRIVEIEAIAIKRKTEFDKGKQDSLNMVLYKSEIKNGNIAFEARNYTRAKSAFQKAQRLNPDDNYAAEKISAIDTLLLKLEEQKKTETIQKVIQQDKTKQYNSAIRQGTAALGVSKYEVAKDFFLQAKALKPEEKLPVSQLVIIDQKLEEISINVRYEAFIHMADSIAWMAKDPKASLRWYDSARILKPQETYPKKQIVAINQNLLNKDVLAGKQQRSQIFNEVVSDFKKAEAFRTERKYEEAYELYSGFLVKLDTLHLGEYMPGELYVIKQAKDYLSRLQNYKPKPKIETMIAPGDGKKKKKKNNKNAMARKTLNADTAAYT